MPWARGASKRFVTISCAAWAEDQLAAKLFGPAEDGTIPLVEDARSGTLCLEDIESLPNALQARLLTFINDQGAPPETRIIAICNQHAPDMTLEQTLRPDLFYRLGAMTIVLPPLRARGEDILQLFTRLSEQFAEEYGCDAPQVTAQEAAQLLQAAPGPATCASWSTSPNGRSCRTGAGRIDRQPSDGRQRGVGPRADDRRQAAEGICRGFREDADRQHDAPAQGQHRRGDGGAVPAARTLNEKMAKYGPDAGDYV